MYLGPSEELVFEFFFFNDPATTEIYTLSLHDALPISASAARVRPHCAAEVTASAVGSLTWKVSMATPSARVAIWAEMILTPCAASVPAIREKRPGTSCVTTTRSEEPRSGWWNSSVATGADSIRETSRR